MKMAKATWSLGIAAMVSLYGRADAVTNNVEVLLQSSGTVFKGLPSVLAVEVRNQSDRVIRFQQCGPTRPIPFMLRVESDNGQVFCTRADTMPDSFISRLHGGGIDGQNFVLWPTWNVDAGESRRFLINAGWCLPFLEDSVSQKFALVAGKFRLTVGIYENLRQALAGKFLVVSEPMDFRVVDPAAQELKSVTDRTGLAHLGSLVMKSAPTPQECEALEPRELRETVALSALFFKIRTAKDIATVSVDEYRPFIGEWLKPEIEQIEFEILLAKGEKDKAAMAKAAILERFPAMRFWVDEAERGAGLCVAIRTGSR